MQGLFPKLYCNISSEIHYDRGMMPPPLAALGGPLAEKGAPFFLHKAQVILVAVSQCRIKQETDGDLVDREEKREDLRSPH